MSYQENPFVPQMLSPTAYEIGRFGRTPASHFYGLPNISIPLTEVRAYWNPIQKRVQELIFLVRPEHMK